MDREYGSVLSIVDMSVRVRRVVEADSFSHQLGDKGD